MTALIDSITNIPHLGFFIGWFALVLLLASALVYTWSLLHRRFADGATPKQRAEKE